MANGRSSTSTDLGRPPSCPSKSPFFLPSVIWDGLKEWGGVSLEGAMLGNLAARRPWGGGWRTTGSRPDLQVPWGVGEARWDLRKTGHPQKQPHHPPHIPFLTVEGPGWGPCTAEIYSSFMECGCWFSHLDFAGTPPITSPHYHHHHHHRHTCIKKTCLLTKAITTSEQMAHLPATTCHSRSASPARAGFPEAWVPWVPWLLALRTPRPGYLLGLVLPWL